MNKPDYDILQFIKSKKGIVTSGYTFLIINIGILIARYLYCIAYLDRVIVSNNIMYLLISISIPFATWIYSTTDEQFNFYNQKLFFLGTGVINAFLTLYQPLYTVIWDYALPKIMLIPINEAMTQGMVVNLARAALILPIVLLIVVLVINLFNPYFQGESAQNLAAWKLKHAVDLRENKDTAYDFLPVKNLKTKKTILIKESDRFVHTLIDGATGVGKTSSVMLTAVYFDLMKKVENRERLEKELLNMVNEKKAYVKGPVTTFSPSNIVPKKKYLNEYRKLIKKYPDCGITVMAPNSGFPDDVVKLCRAFDVPVNVMDPEYDEDTGRLKEGFIGMNPFYVPENLKEEERTIWISEKAAAFSDVMIALKDNGSKDEYFVGINESVTTNIAIICMRGVPLLEHRQPNIDDIQLCINDFKRLEQYINAIENHYKINVKVNSVAGPSQKGAINANTLKERAMETSCTYENGGEDNPYYMTLLYVKEELLGAGAEKMRDQSRGLRNLINGFLMNPRIKKMLTTSNYINFDGILHNGEVTVINTATAIGDSTSTALGLFILLNLKQAVMRRKKNDRKNHFWYIDELPVYIHPKTESMFSLFRQFRVAMIVAIQTLDQMEKNANTKYLKGVITNSCGTQIIFGRVNPSEMKIYSELAGVEEVNVVQRTISKNSILSDNASISMSERVTPTRQNVMEGKKIRNRDFQEVTIFHIDEGRIMPAEHGKVSFLPKECFKKVARNRIDWNKYVTIVDIRKQIKKEDMEQPKETETLMNQMVNDTIMTQKVHDETRKSAAIDIYEAMKQTSKVVQEKTENKDYTLQEYLYESIVKEKNQYRNETEHKESESTQPRNPEQEKQTEAQKEAKRINDMSEEELIRELEMLNDV